jgi:mannose-6-phosphate isomerase-like protein (cupin superfamily)
MANCTVVNLKRDVEDMAPKHGLAPGLESRFARGALELAQSGLTHFTLAPEFRTPFGHRHDSQEEVYLVVAGSVRLAVDDDVVELGEWDVARVPPEAMRCLEGGPEGGEVLAFGAPSKGNADAQMEPGWWPA